MMNTKNTHKVQGVVSAHQRGFGFVRTEEGLEYFVPPALMRELIPGDVVEADLEASRKDDGLQVRDARILSRPESTWQGVVRHHNGFWVLNPDEPCFVRLQLSGVQYVADEQVVSVRVRAAPLGAARNTFVHAYLERVLGHPSRVGFDVDYVLAKHDFEVAFNRETLTSAAQQADRAAKSPGSRDDLREIPFVTIDSASTKDLDDAVWAAPCEDGWELKVAIADVAHYVEPGSPLDLTAKKRGTTVYLPTKIVPMLPESLSQGVCSLVPGEDRLAAVMHLTFKHDGTIENLRWSKAVIRCAQRLSYDEVWAEKEGRLTLGATVTGSLHHLWSIYDVLTRDRAARGTLDFEDKEPSLSRDEQGQPAIQWHTRTPAHKLVEELMLLTNRLAAQTLAEKFESALYRHQQAPALADWEELVQWSSRHVTLESAPDMLALAKWAHALKQEGLGTKARLRLRNAMEPAVYDHQTPHHFSLATPYYTHFTSPIRRYADLVVHRLMFEATSLSSQQLKGIATQCTTRNKAARQGERWVWDKLKKQAMVHTLVPGDCLTTHVVKQSKSGVRLFSEDWQTSVMLDAESLLAGDFRYNEASKQWSREGSTELELGDDLDVLLERVDERHPRFEVIVSLAPCRS